MKYAPFRIGKNVIQPFRDWQSMRKIFNPFVELLVRVQKFSFGHTPVVRVFVDK